MVRQIIGIGSSVNDGTGDTAVTGATKINANFAELYTQVITAKTQNTILAAPTSGAGQPEFRALDATDIPANLITLDKLATALQALLVPIGTLLPYAGSSAPTNFLICDGTEISRTTYADLFTVIGTTFGSGDGSTTFNLPNATGRTLVGTDSAGSVIGSSKTLGDTMGSATHTLTINEMPSHSHAVTALRNAGGLLSFGSDYPTQNATQNTSTVGGGAPHNIIQPSLTVNYIVRY